MLWIENDVKKLIYKKILPTCHISKDEIKIFQKIRIFLQTITSI